VGIYFYQEASDEKTPLVDLFAESKQFEGDDLDD
jgi:hypothetical protein